jgi:hypothetical protein
LSINCLKELAFKKLAFPSIKINTEVSLELTKKAGLVEAFMVRTIAITRSALSNYPE